MNVQQLFELYSKASMRAKILISYGVFFSLPSDALAQDSGQLTGSQVDKFGHPVGLCMGFLWDWSKDAIISSEGLLMIGNLSIHQGKSCYTHTTSMSQIPNSQYREHAEGKITCSSAQPLLAIEKSGGDLKDVLLSNFQD